MPQNFHPKSLTVINIFPDVLLSFLYTHSLNSAKKYFSDFVNLERSSEHSRTSCVYKVIYEGMLNIHTLYIVYTYIAQLWLKYKQKNAV